VNDWLVQEFRDRVSKQRQLRLFTRLAPALKLIQVAVSKRAEEEEEELTQRREQKARAYAAEVQGWLQFLRDLKVIPESPEKPNEP